MVHVVAHDRRHARIGEHRRATDLYEQASYSQGYSYFKLKQYDEAITSLRRFVAVSGMPKDQKADAMLRIGYAIFAIGTLGFLGLGLPPPDPDWGSMVNDARKYIYANPIAIVWPSLAIATLVIGVNLFADGMREEITRYQR